MSLLKEKLSEAETTVSRLQRDLDQLLQDKVRHRSGGISPCGNSHLGSGAFCCLARAELLIWASRCGRLTVWEPGSKQQWAAEPGGALH